MTIKVTIKHDQPGYAQDIIVRQYTDKGDSTEWMGDGQRLKHGESTAVYVYGSTGFAITEAAAGE